MIKDVYDYEMEISFYEPPSVTSSGVPQYEPQFVFSTQDFQHHKALPVSVNQVESTNTSSCTYTRFPIPPGHYPRSPRV